MPRTRKYKKLKKSKILFSNGNITSDLSLEELMEILFGQDTKSSKIAVSIWNTLEEEKDNTLSSELFSQAAKNSPSPKSTWYSVANKMVSLGILQYDDLTKTWELNPSDFISALKRLSKNFKKHWENSKRNI